MRAISISIALAGLLLSAVPLNAQEQPRIESILPTIEQLGADWVTNFIHVSVDKLRPDKTICNGDPFWLKYADATVTLKGREAFARVPYCLQGGSAVAAEITRFKSKDDIGDDWGTNEVPKDSFLVIIIPKVGEEVHFYQRAGMCKGIAFRRGNYRVNVETCSSAPMEKLGQLALVIDGNLVKAQRPATPNADKPKAEK